MMFMIRDTDIISTFIYNQLTILQTDQICRQMWKRNLIFFSFLNVYMYLYDTTQRLMQ